LSCLRARLCVLPDRPQKTCTVLSPLDHKENTMLQKILATLLLLVAIAGCNTMNGFGQDVERGGEKIQEKATR
jgi:entericidin B